MTFRTTLCNYSITPLALKNGRPKFSWVVESDKRRGKQTAFQLLVSSSPDLIEENRGDMWDTQKVESGENYCYYEGKDLESFRRYYWKVRVWDEGGSVSKWSNASYFETGPLEKKDWKAQWIAKKDLKTFKSGGDFGAESYEQYYASFFRKPFELKGSIKKARAYVS